MMKEQETIFSMFDITDEVEEKRKKEEAERQKRLEEQKAALDIQKSTAPKKAKEEKETFEIKVDTQFYHMGEYIPVIEYVTESEITRGIEKKKKGETIVESLSSEELRKRLEKDYPDLIKGYTEIVYVKKKNLVLAVSKAKKKGCGCSKEQFQPRKKKIPFHILRHFVAFSRQVYISAGTECHADVYYDYDTDDFFIDVPQQQASPVNVEVVESGLSIAERLSEHRYRKIMEVHSHHTMKPYPSSTDDENERGQFLYAIVGDLHHFLPAITVRYFDSEKNKHIPLNAETIFESPFVEDKRISKSMLEAVTSYDVTIK
jgi:proteasome lid subunit RPN8/RPN11